MSNYYKLTTQDHRSKYGDCLWGSGVSHRVTPPLVPGKNGIHVYADPLVALCLNPVHANIEHPVVWRGTASGEILTCPDKIVVEEFTALEIEQIEPPSLMQRVAFGILCAREVWRDSTFILWTDQWLSGQDRTYQTAWKEAWAAEAAWAKAAEAAAAATWAEMVAAFTAKAAATMVDAAKVAAREPANAVEVAEMAARGAAWAGEAWAAEARKARRRAAAVISKKTRVATETVVEAAVWAARASIAPLNLAALARQAMIVA